MNHNKQTYDKFSMQYHEKRKTEEDNLWNLYLDRPMIERFLCESSSDNKVLDLGCGSGLLTRWLRDKGFDACGLDFSNGLISIAKNENPDIPFTVADATSTPYPSESFDIIVSGLVMHYVQDLSTVFSEVARILKTNGIFIFTIHHPFDEVLEVSCSDKTYQATAQPYFHNDRYRWKMLDGMELVSYHHTFEAIGEALFNIGFVIERIAESRAQKELRELYPDFFVRTNTYPSFCGFKTRKL